MNPHLASRFAVAGALGFLVALGASGQAPVAAPTERPVPGGVIKSIALDASVVVAGPREERTLKVEELITGPLSTKLESGEILTQVRVPLPPARTAGAYEKLPNPASRFAVVGVAAEVSLDSGNAVQWARVALTGLASKVTRAAKVEQALQGKPADASTVKAASARAAEGLELRPDLTGSAAYKAQLAAVYTERAVLRAISRARER